MPQESNMAELLRLMKTVIVKVDDLATDMKVVKSDVQVLKSDVQVLKSDVQVLKSDVQVLKSDVQEIRTNLGRLETKVDLLGGQFRDVAGQAIEDTQRITSLEGRVDILESKSH